MNNFKLSRITSKFNKGIYKIYQFGYDNEGNFVTKVDNFKDYFYYSAENIGDILDIKQFDCTDTTIYTTLYQENVYKIKYTSIKIRNEISKKYPDRIYESDKSPEFNFILDKGLEWSTERNIMYFDIETWYDPENPRDNMPEKAKQSITSIQCYLPNKNKYFVFSWHPEKTKDFDEPKIINKGEYIFMLCKDEESMILGFMNTLNMMNVDIISGWYSAGYDLPYIVNRCRVLGLPYENLSPIRDVYIRKRGDYWKVNIKGLDHIDMLEGVKDMGYNLPNYKLATVVKEIVGEEGLDKLTHVTWKDWKDNFKGFIEYGIRDVEILKEINDKINMFGLYTAIQSIANLDSLGLVFYKSMIVDNYILKEFHQKLIFPKRRHGQKQSYAGAIVFNPTEPGKHDDVTVMDYTSLYPTSIMAFNLSPETFIASEKGCRQLGIDIEDVVKQLQDDGIKYVDTGKVESLFGERYLFYSQEHKLGLLPYVLKKLFLKRVEITDGLTSRKYVGDERVAMQKRQWAYKIILNSAYGAMGFSQFRLYKPEVADAITYFARQALKFAVLKFKDYGHKTLYGDTDSIFIKSNGKTEPEMVNQLKIFNESLKEDLVKKYNKGLQEDYMLMDLKFEYDMEKIYFGDSKKRYYGIIRDTGEKYIRGMNIIRKDTPEFMKNALNKMAEFAVREQLTLNHVIALREKIESVDYKQIGISKSFTKKFDEYIKTMPQHVKASVWANDRLKTAIKNTDNPYLFYIKSHCEEGTKPRDRQTAICLNEEDLNLIDKRKDIFEIDYETFFEKQVLDQLEEFDKIDSVKDILEEYSEIIKEKEII
ncbi:hypothetical protein CMI47_15880 [Candidatus Pacearchaeota archaeon]|nr:hypothetical protein [Candidatus Pacearchaeota archaeon]